MSPTTDPLPAGHALALPDIWLQAARVSVAAGFPSPAEDHQVDRIELMRQLVRHQQATFFVRIQGDSMQGGGILDGSVVRTVLRSFTSTPIRSATMDLFSVSRSNTMKLKDL